ncbi:MAG: hypothetical protein Q9219_005749 [cf. Caloplaca sp. 3 TL-2023]
MAGVSASDGRKGLHWSQVADELEKEEVIRRWAMSITGSPKPSMPFQDACADTARQRDLFLLTEQIEFEIKEYGKRNNAIVAFDAQRADLAKLILCDRARLQSTYQHGPAGRRGMERCINGVQRQWFESLFLADDGVKYVLSEKAQEKARRLIVQEQEKQRRRQRRAGAL